MSRWANNGSGSTIRSIDLVATSDTGIVSLGVDETHGRWPALRRATARAELGGLGWSGKSRLARAIRAA